MQITEGLHPSSMLMMAGNEGCDLSVRDVAKVEEMICEVPENDYKIKFDEN